MVIIIDYGSGNLSSIKNMLKKAGLLNVDISSDAEVISKAEKLILPGVGHFDFGMERLEDSGLVDILTKKVKVEHTPILGICLGAQLLTRGSEEGNHPGLGWIEADTVRFLPEQMDARLRIPHMGWSDAILKKESILFKDMPENPRFYFVHSYYIICDNPKDELVESVHGHPFTAAFENKNVYGVQFHPEKSHRYGMKLLNNFVTLA